MPRLSIIVPHIASRDALETTILSVLENRPDSAELVVVHAGDYEDPYALDGDELRLVEAEPHRDLVGMLNDCLPFTRGNVIHTLVPGCTVTEAWTDSSLSWFQDDKVATVSPSVCDPASDDRPYSGLDFHCLPRRLWSREKRRGESVAASICGGFYRRSLLVALGGWFQPTSREVAEVELALAAQALGFRCLAEPNCTLFTAASSVEGQAGGYAMGHAAGRLAMAYSQATGSNLASESLAARIGHLAGCVFSPHSVAERLGWVLGVSDRCWAAAIHERLEEARAVLDDQAAVEGQAHMRLRRAA